MKKTALALTLLLPLLLSGQFYNGSNQQFGKNRVQYKDFFWQYVRSTRFETYFYKEGEDLADFVSSEAEFMLPRLEKQLDYRIKEPLYLIVYKSFSDFKQSNIGIGFEEGANIGGTTRIVGPKVFVYYEGSREQLRQQIKSGIAEVLINRMIYGSNFTELMRTSAFMNLPTWYTNGLVSYFGEEFDTYKRNAVKDGVLSGKFEQFNALLGEDAKIAGHSIWQYVSEVYGEDIIPSILYMTKVTRGIESAFTYVLGLNLEMLRLEYLDYYQNKFSEEEEFRNNVDLTPLEIPIRRGHKPTSIALSPKGNNLAYATNIMGQYRIFIHDIEDGLTRKIEKGEHKLNRIPDETYPVLTWHPNGDLLAYVLEKKGKLFLVTYSVSQRKKNTKELFALDKVLSLDFNEDGKTMVFSATQNGQTDLYLYYFIGNRHLRLTFDDYDNFSPRFIAGGKKIVFSSNRPNGKKFGGKEQKKHDLFELTISAAEDDFKQLTFTPEVDERTPFAYNKQDYAYLANKGKVVNRFFAHLDSSVISVDTIINYQHYTESFPLSNYKRNVLLYDLPKPEGQYAMLLQENGKYNFYLNTTENDEVTDLPDVRKGSLRTYQKVNFDNIDSNYTINANDSTSSKNQLVEGRAIDIDTSAEIIDTENYLFEGEDIVEKKPPTVQQDSVIVDTSGREFISTGTGSGLANGADRETRNYNVNFTVDEFVTQFNNSFNNQFYQILTHPDSWNPGFGGYIKMGVTDLFEDYKIIGGVRLSASLINNDYLISYVNLKRRVDKTLILQRQSDRYLLQANPNAIENYAKLITYSGAYEVKYPFSEVAALTVTPSLRYDNIHYLSTDPVTLSVPSIKLAQYGFKASYVYDKSLKLGLNLYSGLRLKLFAEYYDFVKEERASNMNIYGLDFRHYLPIYKQMILASRIAASTSVGNRRVLYFLGGVDSWLYQPKTDEIYSQPSDPAFLYQALVSPMRGFFKGVRSGNSFVVINNEIRIPVAKLLSKQPIKSEFLETFQLVPFIDFGTAWTGKNPFSDENDFNTQTFGGNGNPITVTIETQESPIVMGRGIGVHAKVLGYFIRADWAWGYIDNQQFDRTFYLSLSLDF